MLTLHVNGIDYTVEYTFEAAESEVVNRAFDFFSGAYMLRALPDSEISETEAKVNMLNASINAMADASKFTVDFLFMGLLEHHGRFGDMTQDILTRDDAKMMYKQFAKENQESELALHSGLFEALKKQMEEDDFFKRIGVEAMMTAISASAEEKTKQTAPKKRTTSGKA